MMVTMNMPVVVPALAALLSLAAFTPVALAEEVPPGPPAEAPAAQAEHAVDPLQDPAWQRYQKAWLALVAGDVPGARDLMSAVVAEFPGHPAAAFAQEALTAIAARGPGLAVVAEDLARPVPTRAPLSGAQAPSTQARAELAIFQTLHGVALGAELCVIADCDDGRLWVSSLMGGGAAGLTVSLLGSRGGIAPGHSLAINSGTGWGVFHGVLINVAMPPDHSEREAAGVLMASQLVGTAAGLAIYDRYRPTAGDVSLANSAGIWSGVLALLGHAAGNFEASDRAVAITMMAAADAGLVAGALAAREFPMSRSRTLIIDAGGILGLLAGMGTMVLITNDDVDGSAVAASGIVGTLGGLGAATYFTRDWDEPEEGVAGQFYGTPVAGGMVLGYRAPF